jgi:hypothetical protein
VPLERENRIVAHHAFAVVRHSQQTTAARFDLDCDLRGAGVDGILDQLFGDGSGTLNHFAGGYLIGDMICEDANFSH